MAKKYRVKRYYDNNSFSFKAKPRLVTVLLFVLLFAGLCYVGTIIYKPAYDFVMNLSKEPPPPAEVLPESEPEPDSETEPESEPEPEQPIKAEHKKLRALYIPGVLDIDAVMNEIEGTDFNSVMVDIKNSEGDVLFKTKNEMANKWGVVTPGAIDLSGLAERLESKGLMLAVKMSVFRDPKAASAGRLDYAINYQNSEFLWLDNSPEKGGKPWLNPYSIPAQDYIESIANEAFDAGAKMLVLEDLRFPDNSAVYATFGKEPVSMSRAEILETTVSNLQIRAAEKGAHVAVTFPVTAAAITVGEENRYGGSILRTVGEYLLLDVSPSQFETGFSQGGLQIPNAAADPENAVRSGIEYVKKGIPSETGIIPMLGASPESVLETVKGLGYDEYIVISKNMS